MRTGRSIALFNSEAIEHMNKHGPSWVDVSKRLEVSDIKFVLVAHKAKEPKDAFDDADYQDIENCIGVKNIKGILQCT